MQTPFTQRHRPPVEVHFVYLYVTWPKLHFSPLFSVFMCPNGIHHRKRALLVLISGSMSMWGSCGLNGFSHLSIGRSGSLTPSPAVHVPECPW